MPKFWIPPDLAELCRLFSEGLSMRALGARYGVTHFVIARVLREQGIATRSARDAAINRYRQKRDGLPTPRWVPPDILEVEGLFKAGWSLRALGLHYGVTHKVIARVLSERDIQIRSLSEAALRMV